MPIISTKASLETTFLVVDENGVVTSVHPQKIEIDLTADGLLQGLSDLMDAKDNLELSDGEVKMLVRTGNIISLGNIQAASIGVQSQYQFPTTVGTPGQVLAYQGAQGLQWISGGGGAQGFQGLQGNQGTAGPSTQINASSVTTNSTFYPVFVAAAGSNQTASVDTTASSKQLLGYNPSTGLLTTTGVASASYRGVSSIVVEVSGTSKTLGASDNGVVLMCTSGSATTITVPTGLDVGFNVTVIQAGAGQVSFSASSTTINNRQSQTKTAGQWAVVSLFQRTTNNFVLAGDTGA